MSAVSHSAVLALSTALLDREQSLEEAFPEVEPGLQPFGELVLVQIRTPKRKTKGGIILTDDARDTEKWNQQVAKVISLGPVAFRSRTTLEAWPEGQWCQPGAFVRVPKYGGDRWEVRYGNQGDEEALFVLFKDKDLLGLVTTDPRAVKAFI